MCTKKHWIKTKQGKDLLVDCGKCPSCLQDKANRRAMKILANYPDNNDGTIAIMFGLTYANAFIPYIRKSDIDKWNKYRTFCDFSYFNKDNKIPVNHLCIPIYRDFDTRIVRKSSGLKGSLLSYGYKTFSRGEYDPFDNRIVCREIDELENTDILHPYYGKLYSLRGNVDKDRVGICYYPDLQRFFKRLRINLKRKYNCYEPFTYFACSEYGGKYKRPHFHVLLFTKQTFYDTFARAINEAWSYDYCNPERKEIQVARHAASYVASYVNSFNTVAPLFQGSKQRQRCSYSKNFGIAKPEYSLRSVKSMFDNRSFIFDVEVVDGNCVYPQPTIVPAYVISRYTHKVKGYYKLAYAARYSIYSNPSCLDHFAYFLELDSKQLASTKVAIQNKQKIWLEQGFSKDDFARFSSEVYTIRSSNILKYSHEKIPDLFQYYYNISDFYCGDIGNSLLDDAILHKFTDFEVDPNKFVDVVTRTVSLASKYARYDKSRMLNSEIRERSLFYIV